MMKNKQNKNHEKIENSLKKIKVDLESLGKSTKNYIYFQIVLPGLSEVCDSLKLNVTKYIL